MNIRYEEGAIVLELTGEIDMHQSVDLRDKFLNLLKGQPSTFVVNMANVKYMDSSGAATLVEMLKNCRRCGCQLKLAGLAERVQNVFEICRLESMFQIYDSEAEALS